MSEHVQIERGEDGIAHVRLTRAEKKNAMSLEMFDALIAAGEGFKADTDLRAVILSGEGGTFCAGIDLAVMQSFAPRLDEIREQILTPGPTGANRFQRPCTVWAELGVPVIAAIDGVAFGAGLQLALGADFRIAATDARFSIMEAKWDLIPDMGITQNLPKLLRADQAKVLMMTAQVIDAPEAAELGLVTRLDNDPVAAATRFARELISRSPDALAGAKRLVDRGGSGGADALGLEAQIQAPIIGAPNQIAAVMAEMTGQPAKFGPREG